MTSRKLYAMTAAAALLIATSVPGFAAPRKSVRAHGRANVTVTQPYGQGYDAYARAPGYSDRAYDPQGGGTSSEWPGQW